MIWIIMMNIVMSLITYVFQLHWRKMEYRSMEFKYNSRKKNQTNGKIQLIYNILQFILVFYYELNIYSQLFIFIFVSKMLYFLMRFRKRNKFSRFAEKQSYYFDLGVKRIKRIFIKKRENMIIFSLIKKQKQKQEISKGFSNLNLKIFLGCSVFCSGNDINENLAKKINQDQHQVLFKQTEPSIAKSSETIFNLSDIFNLYYQKVGIGFQIPYLQNIIQKKIDTEMSYQNQNFGMMDQGYFVPRTEILDWINSLLCLNLSKIEQLGSGAVYCQIIDVIHPGKVGMSKVNWKAKNDYQFINNLKILQNAFDKIGIKRHVEVERLARAKYQDNLEFIQWLKRYYDVNCGERGNNYMAEERRGNTVVDLSFAEKTVVPKTYNSNGVVKSQADKKKAISKKEEAPPRIKSPVEGSGRPSFPKKLGNQPKTNDKIKEERLTKQEMEDLQEKEKLWEEELHYYREQSKKSQMKMEMISEILNTEDDADMKLKMIEEILKTDS